MAPAARSGCLPHRGRWRRSLYWRSWPRSPGAGTEALRRSLISGSPNFGKSPPVSLLVTWPCAELPPARDIGGDQGSRLRLCPSRWSSAVPACTMGAPAAEQSFPMVNRRSSLARSLLPERWKCSGPTSFAVNGVTTVRARRRSGSVVVDSREMAVRCELDRARAVGMAVSGEDAVELSLPSPVGGPPRQSESGRRAAASVAVESGANG